MLRDLAVLSLAITIGGSPSFAEERNPEECAQIRSDSSRLECYDLIFKHSRTETEPVHGTGAWNVRIETSRIDDSRNVFLSLRSKEPIRGRYGRNGYPVLIVRCMENETNLYMRFAGHFMSDTSGHGRITYRIDDDPARRVNMRESNNHQALGLWSGGRAVPFAKRLFDRQTLLVRATPYSESALMIEFPIAGIEEAIRPLREACHW